MVRCQEVWWAPCLFSLKWTSVSSLLNLSFPSNSKLFHYAFDLCFSSFLLCACFPIFGAPKWQLQLEVPPLYLSGGCSSTSHWDFTSTTARPGAYLIHRGVFDCLELFRSESRNFSVFTETKVKLCFEWNVVVDQVEAPWTQVSGLFVSHMPSFFKIEV